MCMVLDSLMKMSWILRFILDGLMFLSRALAVFFPISDFGGSAISYVTVSSNPE
jgi:hypothetical protein